MQLHPAQGVDRRDFVTEDPRECCNDFSRVKKEEMRGLGGGAEDFGKGNLVILAIILNMGVIMTI